MTDLDLLIDLHLSNDRQGPGDDAETRRAIELARLPSGRPLAVADLGCGTGASALVLANELDAHVTAIDAAPAFVDRLAERASQAGLGDRIDARVGAMEDPPFEPESLDLIWSEAAIYNVGFEAGVQAWHRFLRPGGMLAVSELVWTTGSRPGEIDAHWKREYPGISTVSANLAALDRAGYRPEAFFILPDQAWDENYYAPLRDAIPGFLDRHAHGAGAQSIADAERAEMSLRGRFGAWYGYAFCIAQRADESAG